MEICEHFFNNSLIASLRDLMLSIVMQKTLQNRKKDINTGTQLNKWIKKSGKEPKNQPKF